MTFYKNLAHLKSTDLFDDMKFPEGNGKRVALTTNRWMPAEGKPLQIPYEIDHVDKEEIENAIQKMNKVLHCHQQAWVPRDSSGGEHYVKFFKGQG